MVLIGNNNFFFLTQLYSAMNNNTPVKLWFTINFLSMGGIPPFLGFMPKWLTVQALMMNSIIMFPMVMIVFTLITIFMYTQIVLSTTLLNVAENMWTKIDYSMKSTTLTVINFFTISSLMLITMAFNIY